MPKGIGAPLPEKAGKKEGSRKGVRSKHAVWVWSNTESQHQSHGPRVGSINQQEGL